MRYVISVLALIVSFGASAESVQFPLKDVVIDTLRYNVAGRAFITLKGRPYSDVCGNELEVTNPETGLFELSTALDIPMTLIVVDNRPDSPFGQCDVISQWM